LVRRSRSVLQHLDYQCLYLSVFRPTDLDAAPKFDALLSCGYALFRVQPVEPASVRSFDPLPAPLMESVPLRRLSPCESTPPRFASPGTFRPQGFSPSRRLSPRQDLPALFQTGNALGVRPPGVFPHRQVPRLLAVELPSWRFFLRAPPRTTGLEAPPDSSRLNPKAFFRAFRALLQRQIRTTVPAHVHSGGRSPLELPASLGSCPAPAWTPRATSPLLRFHPLDLPFAKSCPSASRVALRPRSSGSLSR
jgi:hypothetical protein